MAKVHIDISVNADETSFGMASGPLELPVVPLVGDAISFRLAEKIEAYVGERRVPFTGQLHVTKRIILVPIADADILLILEDITAATPADAARLLKWFEQEHGLFGDAWEG